MLAPGLVNWKVPFLIHTESTSLNRSPKNCHRWLCPRVLQQCKIWWKSVDGGFWANRWNITEFFIYTVFKELTYMSVRSLVRFSRLVAQITWTHARVCLLAFDYIAAHLWGQITSNPNFGAWIDIFQPNAPNIETFILSKLLHRS